MGRGRATNNKRALANAHQKVISSGELFVRALAVQRDLSRRISRQQGNATLLKERRKNEKLVAQLAREYKKAMAAYLAEIRAVLKC
jgi:hypothetical protein